MPRRERKLRFNRARRHFLGFAAAAGARIAAIGALSGTVVSASAAKEKDKDKGGSGPMCLLRGTAIMTPRGEVSIEDLRIGDLVETVRGEALPVKWIGRHVYRRRSLTWNEAVVPIRIRRFALDGRNPHKDLYISPGHALYIDGVLLRATDLVNGTSIAPAFPREVEVIEYYQIVLATHEVFLAEGAPVESFLLGARNYEGFTNFVEFVRLYPEDHDASMTPFAPIVGFGGREHLKALLHLALGRFAPVSSRLDDAYMRIAARGEVLVD
jgi:Hint domain